MSEEELIHSISAGNVERAKGLIEACMDLNAQNQEGRTPLMEAVLQKNMDIIKCLLDRNVLPDIRDREGKTALMLSAQVNYVSGVRVLIKSGACLDIRDQNGDTALMEVAFWGCSQIAEILIKAGASLNIQDREGQTALMEAAFGGRSRIAHALINGRADMDIQDYLGRTALMFASRRKRIEIVKMLIKEGADVDKKDINGLCAYDHVLANSKDGGTPDPLEKEIRHLLKGASEKQQLLNNIQKIPYEDLIDPSKNKIIFDKLFNRGCLEIILKSPAIDNHEKLMRIYNELLLYGKRYSKLQEKIQKIFLITRQKLSENFPIISGRVSHNHERE